VGGGQNTALLLAASSNWSWQVLSRMLLKLLDLSAPVSDSGRACNKHVHSWLCNTLNPTKLVWYGQLLRDRQAFPSWCSLSLPSPPPIPPCADASTC